MLDEAIALVVNAGGQSLRMGKAKALLPVPPRGVPLVAHIVSRLAPLVSERVVVVTQDARVVAATNEFAHVLVLPDRWSEGGALGGVATGLEACVGWAMVVACDMPLVDPAIFATLIESVKQQPRVDAIIPRIAGQAQPFHGLWHRRALPILEAMLTRGDLRVQAALAALDVVWMDERQLGIDARSLAFTNVNTPQEWEEVLAILEDQNRPIA